MPTLGENPGTVMPRQDAAPVPTADLIDLASDAMIVRDLTSGLILLWNKGAEALYGWTAAEVRGLTTLDLLQTQFPFPFPVIEAELRARGTWSGELLHRTRSGRRVTVASSWTLRRDTRGEPPVLLEINTDITARKLAQEALQRTEQRLRSVLESVPDAIITVAADGRVVFANMQATIMFGYSQLQLLALSMEDLVPEHLRERYRRHRTGLLRNTFAGALDLRFDLQGRRKDGSEFPAEVSLSPFPTGGDILVTTVVRDATERWQMQAASIRAETAEQAVRQRDEFLSVAAHELKTPLTSLMGFAEALVRLNERGREPEPEVIQRALRTIGRQSAKLNKLINQLLSVSRIDAGRMRLEPSSADLVAIAGSVADEARARTTLHEIVVNAPTEFPVTVDVVRIEQVLTNLVDNSIKYSPDGGEIRITITGGHGTACISVLDHGIGIPELERGHLFDRYYQAHTDTHRSGMGLGLYISRQIVDLHGGRIEAVFPAGGGTEMVVTVPVEVPR